MIARGASVSRFEVVEPSLEALFIEHVGRPAGDDPTLAPEAIDAGVVAGTGRLMPGRDPILPNAGIIARREYRDRTRSPLFLASTVVLAGLAMLAALAPIGIRSIDRQTVTHIAIVSSDADLATRAAAVADSVLNVPPAGVTDPNYKRPYAVEVATDPDAAEATPRSPERSAGSCTSSGWRAARSTSRSGRSRVRTARGARSSAWRRSGSG